MPVFYDRRTASFNDLSGDSGEYKFSSIPGQENTYAQLRNKLLISLGFSGGSISTRTGVKQQYPVDQTTSVVNMR